MGRSNTSTRSIGLVSSSPRCEATILLLWNSRHHFLQRAAAIDQFSVESCSESMLVLMPLEAAGLRWVSNNGTNLMAQRPRDERDRLLQAARPPACRTSPCTSRRCIGESRQRRSGHAPRPRIEHRSSPLVSSLYFTQGPGQRARVAQFLAEQRHPRLFVQRTDTTCPAWPRRSTRPLCVHARRKLALCRGWRVEAEAVTRAARRSRPRAITPELFEISER